MDNNRFSEVVKLNAAKFISRVLNIEVKEEDVYIVWSCKVLQNNKALVSSYHKGSPYIEITYNGDKGEMYFDIYKKIENHMMEVK